MSKRRRVVGVVFAAVGALLATATAQREAQACGGEWFPEIEVDHRPMGVAMAERQLEAGEWDEAAATIIRVMPHVGQLDPAKSVLVQRAQRVLSVAMVRTDGAPSIQRQVPEEARSHWGGTDRIEREANLTFAVTALRSVSELENQAPSAQSELAEALARIDDGRSEAQEILENLAGSDLIPTPEAYAVLAELRAEAGDDNGRKLALTRCEAMADDATICRSTAQG